MGELVFSMYVLGIIYFFKKDFFSGYFGASDTKQYSTLRNVLLNIQHPLEFV